MKIYQNIRRTAVALAVIALLPISCKKVLDSEYRSDLGPEYFATPDGLQSGLNASYAISRFFWGSEGFAGTAVAGTDEVVRGGDGSLDFHAYQNITPQNGTIGSIWNNSYIAINNLNGVLEFGPDANVPATRKVELLGEAKFLRAFYYFLLVQNFGDVPLNLKFNTTPSTVATRTPVKEVYAAMIKDLTEASAELPDKPSSLPSKGRASKAAAIHLLAKVYLTKGWNTTATEGKADFDKAYATAKSLIDNRATYGLDLEADFANVWKDKNEYGKESIFVMDRNLDPAFSESGYNAGNAADGNKENRSNHYWVCFYTNARNVNALIPGAPATSSGLMARDVINGRPFRRFRPTPYTYSAFSNRIADSRYEKTFQKAWIANTPSTSSSLVQATVANPVTTTRNGVAVTLTKGVDTAIYMPGTEVTVQERQRFKGVIIAPSQYDVEWFPTMIKHLDPSRLHFNDPSDRPIIVYRLAETYLIAAEAAFKAGDQTNATAMLNVIRQRAAVRSVYPAGQTLATAVAAVTINPADVTLNFILEERTREMYGEYNRWYDLVRTQTLFDRVKAYNDQGAPNIKDFHVLRPIPSGTQIDLLTNKDQFPQNPGY
jgi:hypothetical protein